MYHDRFFCVKLRKTYIFILLLLILSLVMTLLIPQNLETSLSPQPNYKIVLDAGHGGIDVGAVGVAGTKESEINLDYSLTLKKLLEQYGFGVVLTRTNSDGLYSEYKNGFKLEDMNARRAIIENESPDLFISIHQNKFSSSTSFGPQIFYQPQSDNSYKFAECVQNSLMKNLKTKNRPIKEGDFYVLNGNHCPSILIECGFLSNPQEEQKLLDNDYKNNFCYYIVCGIFSFLA